MLDDIPAHDLVAQQQLARPEDADLEDITFGDVLEADPADVADQHRAVPVIGDDEPWP